MESRSRDVAPTAQGLSLLSGLTQSQRAVPRMTEIPHSAAGLAACRYALITPNPTSRLPDAQTDGGFPARLPDSCYLPILNILVPQVGQLPEVAGFPFFMVIEVGFLICRLERHLTQ